MAIVTIMVHVRRIEGRNPVDPVDLAGELIAELDAAAADSQFTVVDREGDEATYEITAVRLPRSDDEPAGPVDAECVMCGAAMADEHHGRPRLYCSPACRQRAYRTRSTDPASVVGPSDDEIDGWAGLRSL